MIFQIIGMLLATVFFIWICALGLAQMLYNNIGGCGSWLQTLGGFLIACAGFGAAVLLWMNYSPFTITVAS